MQLPLMLELLAYQELRWHSSVCASIVSDDTDVATKTLIKHLI